MAEDEILRLIEKADEVRKTAAMRPDPATARAQAERLLMAAREAVEDLDDEARRLELAARVNQRVVDLDLEVHLAAPRDPGVAAAPTRVDDPTRVPPGQHLTAGWPILHTGAVPTADPATFHLTVTGLVERRLRLSWADLGALPRVSVRADMHCVTGWSRLGNTWGGVRPRDVLERAGVRAGAAHALVVGHQAYSANLPLEALLADDALLAWSHDEAPLSPAHGGPLRLVVPSRYAWKSVKWAFELRVLDHDVPGYWEARGYHNDADPWLEQRFHGD